MGRFLFIPFSILAGLLAAFVGTKIFDGDVGSWSTTGAPRLRAP